MVPREAMLSALVKLGVNTHLVKVIHSLYRETTAKALFHKAQSRSFKINQGVAQGCPLSPTLFAAFINSLLNTLNTSKIGLNINGANLNNLAYADDNYCINSI